MGGPKALVKLGDVTALEMAVLRLKEAGCSTPTVVVGAQHQDVMRCHQTLDVRWAINTDWELGMFSSLQCGLRSIQPQPTRLLVQLVDHCRVTTAALVDILECSLKHPDRVIRPAHAGRHGHPVVLPDEVIRVILESNGHVTLREILSPFAFMMESFDMDDRYISNDFDTPYDLI
ncbi:MAG: NTP transferase domain-containing protein [Planctomycetota bacterium]